ncbi:MAG: sulfite exporter TauE/SafE family protein [Clostridia bacterium]|nr:sulfite exporter TauE/SafE family protein [Clostridia bacterium]
MDALLDKLSQLINVTPWLGPVAALVSGVLTSLMPCSLSTIPLIIGYVGGAGESGEMPSSRRAFWLSLLFALGSAVVFCVFGLIASLIGGLLEKSEFWLHIAMGVLLVLMALQMWDVINIIPSGSSIMAKNRLTGWFGAFIAGVLAGVFASHCALPVVIALMAVAAGAGKGSTLFGVLLLLFFSIGHAVLSVVAGTSVGFVQKLMASAKYERVSRIIRIVLGVFILLIAMYLFIDAFTEGMH